MKIKEITRQHRRDFTAIFICEHCDFEEEVGGYDDANYHNNVIPKLKCGKCGEVAPSSYEPLATKHPEGYQV